MADLRPSNRYTDYHEHFPEDKSAQDSTSMVTNLLHALGGGAIGAAQGISDIGANVAQFPSDIYSYLTGNPGYKAPRPDIREYAPQSSIGKQAESVGEFASPWIASPGLAAETTLGKAMYNGRLLPRLLTDALLGSAENKDRGIGAIQGLFNPALGKVLNYAHTTPFTTRGATEKLNKAEKLASERMPLGFEPSNELIGDIEHQFKLPQLRPSQRQIDKLLSESLGGEFGPTKDLQSALGSISHELMSPGNQEAKGLIGMLLQPKSSAAERLTGRGVKELQQRLLSELHSHLEKTGNKDISDLLKQGQIDYSKHKAFKKVAKKVGTGVITGTALSIPGYKIWKQFL